MEPSFLEILIEMRAELEMNVPIYSIFLQQKCVLLYRISFLKLNMYMYK